MGMTREEFIEELEAEGFSYEIDGDRVIVTHSGFVALDSIQTLPQGVEFKNGGGVYLDSLQTLPQGIEFKNGGCVNLKSLGVGWIDEWSGNIEGINLQRLLNVMISLGIFDKSR